MQDRAYCEMEQRALRAEAALQKARQFQVDHEKCIEEIDADQLAMAERENELHDEKDVALKVAREEIKQLKGCLSARDRGLARQAWLLKNANTAHRPAHRPAAERSYIDRVIALEQRAEGLERAVLTFGNGGCYCYNPRYPSTPVDKYEHDERCVATRAALGSAPETT
jgi:hypothetical protein